MKPPAKAPLAIVIDTNCWEKGHFNRGRLDGLAKQTGKKGIEVWVPGQVVVEWARHSTDDVLQSNSYLGRLYKAGLLPDKPDKLPEGAVWLESELRGNIDKIGNVRILRERGESATAAIRDQILGTGPGSVIKGVRTGAVDSAMVRDVAAEAGSLDRVVFMTNNKKDFEDAAKSLGYESVVIHPPGEINAFLAKFPLLAEPAPPAMEPEPDLVAVASLLGSYFVSLEREARTFEFPDPPLLDPWLDVFDLDLEAGLFDDLDVTTTTEIRLTPRVTVIGIWNVEALESTVDEHERSVIRLEFKLALCGDVGVDGYDLDNDGSIVMQNDTVFDALIVVPFVVEIADDEVILVPPEQSDLAEVSRPKSRFGTAEDALDWLIDMLSASTGVVGVPESDGFVGKPVVLQGVRTVSVDASESQDEGWEADFDLGDDGFVTIGCAYDPGARAWLGSDSFHVLPPFVITVGGREAERAEHCRAVGNIWRYLMVGDTSTPVTVG